MSKRPHTQALHLKAILYAIHPFHDTKVLHLHTHKRSSTIPFSHPCFNPLKRQGHLCLTTSQQPPWTNPLWISGDIIQIKTKEIPLLTTSRKPPYLNPSKSPSILVQSIPCPQTPPILRINRSNYLSHYYYYHFLPSQKNRSPSLNLPKILYLPRPTQIRQKVPWKTQDQDQTIPNHQWKNLKNTQNSAKKTKTKKKTSHPSKESKRADLRWEVKSTNPIFVL